MLAVCVALTPSAIGASDKPPRLLGYRYHPPAVPGRQATFDVDAVDPDGQIVGVRLDGAVTLVADGGCNLGGRRSGDPAHFRIPIRPLADGKHTIVITVSSSTCRSPARVEEHTERVTLRLPGDRGTDTHARCDSPTAKRLVRGFARALSAGRARRADRMWAREPAFEWYSTGAPRQRLRGAARNRATLLGHFRASASQHERLRITQLTARYELRRDIANFHGTLRRGADDLPPTAYGFKGAATCERGRPRLVVWSMAGRR